MKKFLKVLLSLVGALVGIVLVAIIGLKVVDRVYFNDFYSKSEKAFKTPGANDGFVQQGFDYVEADKKFLVAGYMKDTSAASRVYVVDEKGESVYTELLYEDGSNFNDHTGGVECNGEYVYITYTSERYASGLAVFSYADILSGKTAKMLGLVNTYNDPAHCYIQDGYMYAGSFFIEEDYETPAHERVTTPAGDENSSFITVFKMEKGASFGIDPTPKAIVSSRRCVQGMCFTDDGKIVLSTSYGLSASQLFIYDTSKMDVTEGYTFEGETNKGEAFKFEGLKLAYLDSDSLVESFEVPPMSEELVYLDGKIYILSESACNKYIFGKFTSGYDVHAYKYEDEE